jgi:1,4-alpha-glucan branching enzyme
MARKQPSRSAEKKKRVLMAYKAPEAQSVVITGSFCNWETNSYPMEKDGSGLWKRALSLGPGQYEYRLIVDGQWCNDPACSVRVPNVFGTENCILHV